MSSISPHTVAELLYWSYANLAMAHNGIERGLPTYDKTSFTIRMRLYKGLLSGKMQVSTLSWMNVGKWKTAPAVFTAVPPRTYLWTIYFQESKEVPT